MLCFQYRQHIPTIFYYEMFSSRWSRNEDSEETFLETFWIRDPVAMALLSYIR